MSARELLDDATGQRTKADEMFPARQQSEIAATHSHTAPGPGLLGSRATRISCACPPHGTARPGDRQGHPAPSVGPELGCGPAVNDPSPTLTRWVFRPDQMRNDPFGELTVRCKTCTKGYQSPDAIGPTGPDRPPASRRLDPERPTGNSSRSGELLDALVGTKTLSDDIRPFCDSAQAAQPLANRRRVMSRAPRRHSGRDDSQTQKREVPRTHRHFAAQPWRARAPDRDSIKRKAPHADAPLVILPSR